MSILSLGLGYEYTHYFIMYTVCVCVCLDVWRVGGKMEGEWLKEGRIILEVGCLIKFHRAGAHLTIPCNPDSINI